MNLEKTLHPKANKLNKKNGRIDIVDIELDLIQCQVAEDCIVINTDSYKYITLDKEKLFILIEAIEEMEEMED